MHWKTLFRPVIDVIAGSLGLGVAKGIGLARIEVIPYPMPGGQRLRVRYLLTDAPPPTDGAVGVDRSTCPLESQVVPGEAYRCSEIVGRITFGRRGYVFCDLQPGRNWSGTVIEADVLWPDEPAASARRVLTLPLELPWITNLGFDLERRAQPAVAFPERDDIGFIGNVGPNAGPYSRVALYRGPTRGPISVGTDFEVVWGGEFATLGESIQARIQAQLARVQSFLAAELQCSVPLRLLVADPSGTKDAAEMQDGCLLAPVGAFEPGIVNECNLARELAGVWWGSSCLPKGDAAQMLWFTIRSALALRWVRHVDAAGTAGLLAAFEKQTVDRRLSTDVRRAVATMLSLYKAIADGGSVLDALRALTAAQMGYWVPVGPVLECLQQAGWQS